MNVAAGLVPGGTLTSTESSLLVAFVAGTVGAAAAMAFGRWTDATNRRRETYAEAVQILYSWAEYPYRIRRRTSNGPADLSSLAEQGHNLQEKLRWYETWVTTECHWLGAHYSQVVVFITGEVGPVSSEAWHAPPISAAQEMVLGGWGPPDCSSAIKEFQAAVTWRFGLRRAIGWIPGVKRRTYPQS
jgi:hypothetical protein